MTCNYVVGNVAFSTSFAGGCTCACHYGASLVFAVICCPCRNYGGSSKMSIIPDNTPRPSNIEIDVLRETINRIQERIRIIEEWKRNAKILLGKPEKTQKFCHKCGTDVS